MTCSPVNTDIRKSAACEPAPYCASAATPTTSAFVNIFICCQCCPIRRVPAPISAAAGDTEARQCVGQTRHAIQRCADRGVQLRQRPGDMIVNVQLPSPLKHTATLVSRSAPYWSADNASTVGAALAFYCAFSLAPLLVILSTLAGFFIGSTAAYGEIGYQLTELFGPATANILLGAVKSSQQSQGVMAAWVSAVTLVISATTVFSALESALESIWEDTTEATRGIRGWIRRRLLSVGFILALGFLLLVSLTVTTALAT